MAFENTTIQTDTRSRLEGFYWAGALIWAGLIFGVDTLGYLPQIGTASSWTWVLIGVGIYGLALCLYSIASPEHAPPTTWDYIWSGFWLLLGLSDLFTFDLFWSVVFISGGIIVLWGALRRSG